MVVFFRLICKHIEINVVFLRLDRSPKNSDTPRHGTIQKHHNWLQEKQ